MGDGFVDAGPAFGPLFSLDARAEVGGDFGHGLSHDGNAPVVVLTVALEVEPDLDKAAGADPDFVVLVRGAVVELEYGVAQVVGGRVREGAECDVFDQFQELARFEGHGERIAGWGGNPKWKWSAIGGGGPGRG